MFSSFFLSFVYVCPELIAWVSEKEKLHCKESRTEFLPSFCKRHGATGTDESKTQIFLLHTHTSYKQNLKKNNNRVSTKIATIFFFLLSSLFNRVSIICFRGMKRFFFDLFIHTHTLFLSPSLCGLLSCVCRLSS